MVISTASERKRLHEERMKSATIEKIKGMMEKYGVTLEDIQKNDSLSDKDKLSKLREIADNKEKHRKAIKAANEARKAKKEEKTQLLKDGGTNGK